MKIPTVVGLPEVKRAADAGTQVNSLMSEALPFKANAHGKWPCSSLQFLS